MSNPTDMNINQVPSDVNIPNFKEIINYLKCGALIINSSSSLSFEYANEYFYDLVGYTPEEYKTLYNNSISPRIYEDDVPRLRAAISRQLSMAGNTIKYEFRIQKKDGSISWVMLQGRKSNSDPQRIYASLVDITELKDLYNTVAEKNLELDTLYNNIVGGIIKLSAMDFRVISANDGFYKLIGYTKEEFLHQFNNIFADIVYKKDIDKLQEFGASTEHSHSVTLRLVTKTGDKLWFIINASRIDSNDDNPIYLCTITDITDNKTYEKTLEIEQKKRALLAQISGELVWEYDYKSKAFTKGKSLIKSVKNSDASVKEDMKQNYRKNIIDQEFIHPEDIPAFQKFCDAIDTGEKVVEMDIRIKDKNESFYSWYRSMGQTIYNKDGKPVSIIGKTYSTDDTHDALNALKVTSNRDTLTNLYNKGSLERKIQNKINTKSLKTPYAFILADINDFKKINESFGHLYGDSVIQGVATIFEKICPSHNIARIGTDVYAMLIEDLESQDVISTLVENIKFELDKKYNTEANSPSITCSFGINYTEKNDDNYEIMFRKADIALYTAKSNKENEYIFFDSSLGYNSLDYCTLNEYNVKENFNMLQASIDTALITSAIDLLFDSKDLLGSINILMNKLKEHFECEYVRFVSIDETNTDRYNIKSIAVPEANKLSYKSISKQTYTQHKSLFNSDHVLYCSDISTLKDIAQKVFTKLDEHNSKSILQCSNIINDKMLGYICIGNCSKARTWTTNQVRTFSILSKIIFTAASKIPIE